MSEKVALKDFPVRIELPVQWGDMDALGHVNNTIYLRWMESARIEYLSRIYGTNQLIIDNVGPILASVQVDYFKSIKFPDRVECGASITKLGRSSYTMEYGIFSKTLEHIAVKSTAVIVKFNLVEGKSVALTDEEKQKIELLQEGSQ